MYFPQFRRHAGQVIVGCGHRQQVRTVSILLSIERNRSDRICRFCLIRQLGSSLYFGRFLTDGFDAQFANRPLRTGQGKWNGAQWAEHAWCSASEEGFVVIFRQTCGLQVFPIDSENNTITSIRTTCLGPDKARARIGGPAHRDKTSKIATSTREDGRKL